MKLPQILFISSISFSNKKKSYPAATYLIILYRDKAWLTRPPGFVSNWYGNASFEAFLLGLATSDLT